MAALQLVGPPEHAILSSSTALMPASWAVLCHDVNGYYRDLGVTPNATRAQLMRAYRARAGETNPYLTYVFSQLLSRDIRKAYDATPLGRRFLDKYEMARQLRHASVVAARESARHGTTITAEDIIQSLLGGSADSKNEFLAPAEPGGFDGGTRDRQPSLNIPEAWPYSFLLLVSTCTDVFRLAQWQGGLARALADQGIPQFAVGFHGHPEPDFLVMKDLGTPVFFLNEKAEVTGELIAAAATAAVG
ncbi:hypothetical protein [Streptomyces sp. NPDC059761]|uniref:hypothetical protein n=1 Tax=Streptomyces sp. NPDC059761 TaxID=3346937 RepID=UPI00364C547B